MTAYGLTGLPEAPETESPRDVSEPIFDSLQSDYLTPLAEDDHPRTRLDRDSGTPRR